MNESVDGAPAVAPSLAAQQAALGVGDAATPETPIAGEAASQDRWPGPDLAAVIDVLDTAEQRRFSPEAVLAGLGGTLMRIDGRAARSEYWWGTALLGAVWALLALAALALLGSTSLIIVAAAGFGLIVLLPFVVVLEAARAVRRLHDADLVGWWVALALIPGGVLALVWLLTRAGTPGANRFGAMSQPGWDRTQVLSA